MLPEPLRQCIEWYVSVLASLQNVVPGLTDHQQALVIAFERMVSGRHPERRGNGLKFVRSVINVHAGRGLMSVSGRGALALGGLGPALLRTTRWPKPSVNQS